MNLQRLDLTLRPDPGRVFFRPFEPTNEARAIKILARIFAMSDQEIDVMAQRLREEFGSRHTRLLHSFRNRCENLKHLFISDRNISDNLALVIGAHFTQEYALEAAALFNPSIVPAPGQSPDDNTLRFVLSLRATGEGHISSITFRTGVVDSSGKISLDTPSPFVTSGQISPHSQYDKELFLKKCLELGLQAPLFQDVFEGLNPEGFTYDELHSLIRRRLQRNRLIDDGSHSMAQAILALAQANYSIEFAEDQPISERVLFPLQSQERKGLEDARFVRFVDDDGSVLYYATYTAFDGKVLLPSMLETEDFRTFKICTLNGPEVQNKGMALFPRKINGRYAMISRQDNENLYLMYSDHPHFWTDKVPLLKPTYPWEFVQIGNCGSPIETDAGWLLLTHGVGAMRKYVIGAVLLDRDDPSRVIGRLPEPLISPSSNEREGYVPNVLYSCGGMTHKGHLVLPYAMSDQATTFATFDLNELLNELRKNP